MARSNANPQRHAEPPGWTATVTGNITPQWTEEHDDNAPFGTVLKQVSTAFYPLALKNGTSLKDGFVEVRFKTVFGFANHAGGLVWRAQDALNYYLVRADVREGNIGAYKATDGVTVPLDIFGRIGGRGVAMPMRAGRWHDLRVEFTGSRFKVFFNDGPLFEVEDTTFAEAGQVGLWTKSDGVTLFEGFAYGAPAKGAMRRRGQQSGPTANAALGPSFVSA